MPTPAQLEMMLGDLRYMALPAFIMATVVMAAFVWIGGVKQSEAGAALALMAGAVFGLAVRDVGPLLVAGESETPWSPLPHILTLSPGESAWNRLPWVVLAALGVGHLARLRDNHSGDGWLLRGGAAIGIAWWLLPDRAREETVWLAPAFAAVIWTQWVLLDYLAQRPGSISVAGCLVVTLLTGGTVLLYAAAKSLTDPMIVLAFALLGVAIIAQLRGVEVGGAMSALAVAIPGLMLMGQLTTERVEWQAFALTAAAPFTLVLTLPFVQGPKWRLHLFRVALVLAPLVLAILIARTAGPLPTGEEWE
jgi:hypothetical protein